LNTPGQRGPNPTPPSLPATLLSPAFLPSFLVRSSHQPPPILFHPPVCLCCRCPACSSPKRRALPRQGHPNLSRPCRAPQSGSPPSPPLPLSHATLPFSSPPQAALAKSGSGVRCDLEWELGATTCALLAHRGGSVGPNRWLGAPKQAQRDGFSTAKLSGVRGLAHRTARPTTTLCHRCPAHCSKSACVWRSPRLHFVMGVGVAPSSIPLISLEQKGDATNSRSAQVHEWWRQRHILNRRQGCNT
jgi:hypothetical protein